MFRAIFIVGQAFIFDRSEASLVNTVRHCVCGWRALTASLGGKKANIADACLPTLNTLLLALATYLIMLILISHLGEFVGLLQTPTTEQTGVVTS